MAEQKGHGQNPSLPPGRVCGLNFPSPSSLARRETSIPGSWMMNCMAWPWLMVPGCDPQACFLLVYFHFFQSPWPLLFHALCQLCFLLLLHFCSCKMFADPQTLPFLPPPPTVLLSSYLSAPFFSGVFALSFFFLSSFLPFFSSSQNFV